MCIFFIYPDSRFISVQHKCWINIYPNIRPLSLIANKMSCFVSLLKKVSIIIDSKQVSHIKPYYNVFLEIMEGRATSLLINGFLSFVSLISYTLDMGTIQYM